MTDCKTKRLPVRGTLTLTRMAWLAGASALALQMPALHAQAADPQSEVDVPDDQAEVQGEITVTGIRDTIQNSIASKRDSDLVFDALSADEIGDLPALSIGEALETLTGAGSHREQGGATEISIRGLGPFLGSTVINGRIATNGSGDRSVNFSQFPSELFNQVGIYKTQSASLIEGGVAGQIILDTVKPLDFGKRRIQGEFKLNINPDNLDIDPSQRFQKFGYRGTLSYVDQFKLGDGELGLSLGYQTNSTTNPEQEAAISNTLNYCRNDPTSTTQGLGDDGNCNTTRPALAGTEDFVIARNSYSYRQNITDDNRDSFFGAVQWEPSPTVNINADFQYSRRTFRERRNDLNFSEGRRIDDVNDAVFNATGTTGNRLPFDLIVSPTGALRQFTGETSIETNSEFSQRDEKYYGGGLSLEWEASDRLTVSADLSYSETQRLEQAVQVRQRIRDDRDIFGVTGRFPDGEESDGTNTDDRIETAYLIAQNGSQITNFVVRQFDVNDHDLFSDNARARYDLEQDRFNAIWGARADFEYELDGFLSSIQGGVRFQDLVYRDVPGADGSSRVEVTYSNAALTIANQACRTAFPESGFLSSVSGGNPLVTNVDNLGNVISTTNTYATFDALCLARTLQENNPSDAIQFGIDGLPIFPTGEFDSTQNSDVNEKTYAVYLQANYDGELGSLPVSGNFGLRVVKTDVTSSGFRSTLTSVTNPTTGDVSLIEDVDSLILDVAENSYTEFLPSFNLTAELQSDVLGRFAVYRSLSRPDPSSLSFGRQFAAANGDDDAQTVVEALGVVSATGNPFTDPLLSWNIDAGLEWYPNPDTILAFNAYYKSFNGGFETIGQQETFVVDGAPINAFVSTVQTTDETSTIYGLEITAAHRLSWLPAPLDGLGFKLSYNYADSNFEFEDDTLGEITTVGLDGTLTTLEALIPPANLFGFSKHVLSAQAYYQIGGLDVQGVYKYRSNYFQQFIDTPGRIRYTDDVGVFEARISYKLTKDIRLSVEGLNLFNEPRTDFRGAPDDLGQVLVYGPRYFAGIRVKF